MVTEPRTNSMWYNKLNEISSIDDMVQDINVAIKGANNGFCLSLVRNLNANQPFTLKPLDCNEKMSVTCRVENSETIFHQKLPTFPCMTPNRISREKRSEGDVPKDYEHGESKPLFSVRDKCHTVLN